MRQAKARVAGKRGFTLIELLVVVAIIALLISILMPSLARARELSKRTVCASNVKGIGLGFASYAAANNDAWPVPNHKKSTSDSTTLVTYQKATGAKRGNPNDQADGETFDGTPAGYPTDLFISTTRAFWMLVRAGNTPKSFVCPSATSDTPNSDDNPGSYWDFGLTCAPGTTCPNESTDPMTASSITGIDTKAGWAQCSYGYQVPFGTNGQPSPNVDPDMALVADKGPYGTYFESSQTVPPPTAMPTASGSPEEWKKFNSSNHGGYNDGEGQNVMYNDGHVDFFTTPVCGVAKDNIYTQWPSANPLTQDLRAAGNQPTGVSPNVMLAPWGVSDSLIYP
jgi:prepilin-type N-terminal cleavage/methylation domain-containing protein